MPSLGHCTKSNGHLLNIVCYRYEKEEKPYQVITILGSCCCVGSNATGIIVGNHHDKARPCNDQVKSNRFPGFFKPVVENGKDVHIR